jgi:hypothetical protein
MYSSPTALIGATVAAGGLAFTGFNVAWYVITASFLIASGLLLLRLGHRRAAQH